MQLTILMPCLNEAETLGKCIGKALAWIDGSGLDAEVLVADNGSTDGSQDIAKSLGARVVTIPHRGYGAALFYGAMSAKGQWIIMGDSDDSYDFSCLDAFVAKLTEGYDLVMGNRFLGGIAPGAMPWKNRYIGNPVLTGIGRLLFRCPSGDFHCGLRAFTKDAFLRMDLRTTGMEFASEIVIKATLFGMRIAEVPTMLNKDGRSRAPHLKPWRDGWRHLRFMLLFSPRWLFVIPGLVLSLVSFMLYVLLLNDPVSIFGVILDVHTLFFAGTGIVLGYLSFCFGVIVRIFGIRENLLPEHGALDRLRASPVLEIGGSFGIALLLGGFVLGGISVHDWGRSGFGPLQSGELLRQVSVSTVAIMVGGITLMTSFVSGFLALPTRRSEE